MNSRFLLPALNLLILGHFLQVMAATPAFETPPGDSFYTDRVSDEAAVYLDEPRFKVAGDGQADDTDALQAAINAAQEQARFGIVFVPEGRYRLGRTVYVWKGIRLIGFGETRPVFVLGDHTPGFRGDENAYMINFVSDRPEPGEPIRPANPGTFYSAVSNIDFEIGEGNPSAVAVRSHFAQHCYLAHIDFRIGSGKAGVEKVGNEIDDCRFFGGDYGIITTKPSPSWPFLMIDSTFEGQRIAAISTEQGGLTLIRNEFLNVPSVIVVNPERTEELFISDSRFRDVSGPAIVISDEYNARPQYNLINVSCENVPVLAKFRRSDKTVTAPSPFYRINNFTHGLQIDALGAIPSVETTHSMEQLEELPPLPESDIPDLPPQSTWANLKALGVAGDGVTDDTEAIRKAIDTHRALYLPTGRYRVTDTISLKPDTVIIGLSPITTQIMIDNRSPNFHGEGEPKALLETPSNGTNIVTGIGLNTRGINSRAVGCKWMAGADSLMNDVRFLGGHGTYRADGSNVPVYNEFRTADGNPEYKWDTQHASLWVTNGGGGTFKDIWTPSPYASAGLLVSNTDTPGRIYAMSSEHHVRFEARFHNVSNWKIHALQMEEESAEGPRALPVEILDCRNLLFANLYLYRAIRMNSPFPYAVYTKNSSGLDFRGIHVYSPGKFSFDNALYDATHDFEVRPREIARLQITGDPPIDQKADLPPTVSAEASVEKVVNGFEFIDSLVLDPDGNPCFVDSRFGKIYRWSVAQSELKLIRELPFPIGGIAFDPSGNLIAIEPKLWRWGNVYAFDPAETDSPLIRLEAVEGQLPKGKPRLLPGHLWRDAHDFHEVASSDFEAYFVTPDGSGIIPDRPDLYRAFSLKWAVPGNPFHIADEFGQKTYRFEVSPKKGTLVNPTLIAEEGELDVAVDVAANVYVAAGEIHVFSPHGRKIGTIRVPERPASLIFGGSDRRTLYIAARSTLYRIRLKDGNWE